MEPIETSNINEKIEPGSPVGRNPLWAFLLAVVLLAGLFWYIVRPTNTNSSEQGAIAITSGESLKSVGTKLQNAHIIESRVVFASLVTFLGGEHTISPGDYVFKKGESLLGIARQIARGQHGVDQIKITIPEGETNAEIANTILKKIPNFDTKTFLDDAKNTEGYLFPETYFVYSAITPRELTQEMIGMFNRQTKNILTPDLLGQRGQNDVVVMASLIEKEAHGDDDRAMISGILWNRIDRGVALQVDATVAYASGKQDTELQKKDFLIDSPYNTYIYKGLPAGPIANPGVLALKAAISPATTDYLYYLHDKHGTIHYAKTYAEHLKNIARYLK